ncbi:hypothetical protein ILYODFUR_032127 [Ilyodon furcidens]|uniref:Uncharacterized protein n=1 Tax=Ilyodon furcidens TaxID=33524 RepID=A0ABV0TCR9_9TELE
MEVQWIGVEPSKLGSPYAAFTLLLVWTLKGISVKYNDPAIGRLRHALLACSFTELLCECFVDPDMYFKSRGCCTFTRNFTYRSGS